MSPVTSSKSLSPLTKRGRGRVPGFPQRVTQTSASTNNVSESSETGLARGHRHTGPVESVTERVQPTSANNLSLGLLGRLLSQSERDWTFIAAIQSCSFPFSCNKAPLIDLP